MQSLSGIYKITFVGLAVLVAGAGYFFYQSQAGTTINVTLDSNDSLNRGLVMHYTFDGKDMALGSSTGEVVDRGSAQRNGNWINHATTTAMGVMGQGLELDGADDYISALSSTQTENLVTQTVAMWVYMETGPADNEISILYNKRGGGTSGPVFQICRNNSWDGSCAGLTNTLSFLRGFTGDDGKWSTASNAVSIGAWHHVAVSHDASSVTNDPVFYVDGIPLGVASEAAPTGTADTDSGMDVWIGNHAFFNLHAFDGKIDDFRLYNRILSAEEVKRLYQLGATTKIAQTLDSNTTLENGLVMHYTFDGKDINYSSTTAEILDKSGNNLHGDWINHATTTVQGVIGQAINIQQGSAPYSCVRNASSSLISTLGPMTMGVWVKDTPSGVNLFEVGAANPELYLGLQGADVAFRRDYVSSNLYKEAIPSFSMHTSAWTHYAVTWDGTTASTGVNIYGNGELITDFSTVSDGSGTPNSLGGIVHIGCNIYNDQGYEGPMDDFRIYNRVLSADEVKRLYQLGATTKVAQTLPGIEDGLVGHWTFDGPVSSGIPDVSGNGYTGYFMSSVATATALTQGVTGQGVYIDGYDEHYPYADTVDNMSTFTVCAWVRPSALTNRDGDPSMNIISKGWSLSLQNTGRYQMYVPTSGVYGWVYSSSVARLGEWQHVCGIHYNTSTDPAVFFNGVREIYSPQGPGGSLEDNSSRRLFIGGTAGNSTYENFYGSIDDVRVYNRALSAEEVKRLYELGR